MFSLVRAVVMSLFSKVLKQGKKQQPQVTRIAAKIARGRRQDAISPFHLPNAVFIQLSRGLSIPESAAMSCAMVRKAARTLVTEPSGASIVRDKCTTRTSYHNTPPFSASRSSRAFRFCMAIRDVGASCSDRPVMASRVRWGVGYWNGRS